MTIASAIFMALVAMTVLLIARSELVAERIERAHAIVEGISAMADGFKKAADRGEMTEEEAAVHPQRHILTRALGVASQVDTDMWELELRAGDE